MWLGKIRKVVTSYTNFVRKFAYLDANALIACHLPISWSPH